MPKLGIVWLLACLINIEADTLLFFVIVDISFYDFFVLFFLYQIRTKSNLNMELLWLWCSILSQSTPYLSLAVPPTSPSDWLWHATNQHWTGGSGSPKVREGRGHRFDTQDRQDKSGCPTLFTTHWGALQQAPLTQTLQCSVANKSDCGLKQTPPPPINKGVDITSSQNIKYM